MIILKHQDISGKCISFQVKCITSRKKVIFLFQLLPMPEVILRFLNLIKNNNLWSIVVFLIREVLTSPEKSHSILLNPFMPTCTFLYIHFVSP